MCDKEMQKIKAITFDFEENRVYCINYLDEVVSSAEIIEATQFKNGNVKIKWVINNHIFTHTFSK